MVFKEIALNPDNPTEWREVKFVSTENLKISCEADAHIFHWFDDDPVPAKCICGRVDNLDADDRVMHQRNLRVVYGNFNLVPLTVNQEEPYFVHEWDANDPC